MKVCIIGWYGTETIGDRAIIAGIYSFLVKAFKDVEINLGSLYPFYSERMNIEDHELYKIILNKDIKINIFNSRNKKELEKNIKESDVIIMGGGPIMHIEELFMVEYAFRKAKQLNKKTGIIGCGIGPLFTESHKRITLNIINNSDVVILRDKNSKKYLENIISELESNINIDNVKVSFDPAVECALKYVQNKKNEEAKKSKEIIVNLRDFPQDYSKGNNRVSINEMIEKFVVELSEKFKNNRIRLIPMHYFHIGNDDRIFLNKIKIKYKLSNVIVQNEILTLRETMDSFLAADYNIGMRFHSVVLQTILSGKNFVLDYTEPNKGKIFGFISDIDKDKFYKDRFICLQEADIIPLNMINRESIKNKFEFNLQMVNDTLNIYIEELKKLREV